MSAETAAMRAARSGPASNCATSQASWAPPANSFSAMSLRGGHARSVDERRLGPLEHARLPAMTADDEIDGALAGFLEADHAGQRIRGIAASHRHAHAGIRKRRPQGPVQTRARERQEIDVVRGAGHAMRGHRRGPDHRVRTVTEITLPRAKRRKP